MSENIKNIDKVVVKFVGDSGDGMQLTGTQFTETSALYGNDLATFPDFPAEIRAPQGTVPGVSGFQVQIGHTEILTAGDAPDVLVCMNPASLKANLGFLEKGKTLIIDDEGFKRPNALKKAQWESNPLEDGTLDDFKVILAPITVLTRTALKESGIDNKSIIRCKNMFALGIVYYIFNRPLDYTEKYLDQKFGSKPELANANKLALRTGFNYADTIEAITSTYTIAAAKLPSGKYRNIMGNQATAWGLLAAAENSKRELFFGSYPITPASDILHEITKHKQFGSRVFQAEDEIAAICSAIGASFAGNLAITSTSGPGLALKGEAIGLAVMTELPIVIIDVQRGGPSTGLPTKTEQSDLMQAIFGRNGECPAIVIAASTPSNCFDFAYQACKLSLEHMTPVILLTDGYIANGAGPWKIKSTEDLSPISPKIAQNESEGWMPYQRDPETLAREWAIPGTKGLEHRIGGLEKQDVTGNVSYDPENHQHMTDIRQEKVARVANYIPEQKVTGAQNGKVLVIGWGGTYGSMYTAHQELLKEGKEIGFSHFNYISPLPKNTEEIFKNFDTVLVCELNKGQFFNYLKMNFPNCNFESYNKVKGIPFTVAELAGQYNKYL